MPFILLKNALKKNKEEKTKWQNLTKLTALTVGASKKQSAVDEKSALTAGLLIPLRAWRLIKNLRKEKEGKGSAFTAESPRGSA